jgi:Thiamine pyrophosphate enzyme, C-terminal TPP binding domain
MPCEKPNPLLPNPNHKAVGALAGETGGVAWHEMFQIYSVKCSRRPALQLAYPGRQTIAVCGDSSFAMLDLRDISTQVERKANVVHIFLNNESLEDPSALSLPSRMPFHTAKGYTLSMAKQVLGGQMNSVIKTTNATFVWFEVSFSDCVAAFLRLED